MGTHQKAPSETRQAAMKGGGSGGNSVMPGKSRGKFWQFLQEVVLELKRTSWPSRAETTRSTLVVLAVIVIIAGWIVVCDGALSWITEQLQNMKIRK